MKSIRICFLGLALLFMLAWPAASLITAAENYQTCQPGENLETCQARILKQAGGGTSGYGDNANITEATLAQKVGQVVGMVLSVFGVVFFGMVFYSGIQWLTAGGNEEKVTHARERIMRAAIGLGIVMMAYALTSFIVSRMQLSQGEPVINCSQYQNQEQCAQQGLYCQWIIGDQRCENI